jgi:hypothetical protein
MKSRTTTGLALEASCSPSRSSLNHSDALANQKGKESRIVMSASRDTWSGFAVTKRDRVEGNSSLELS